MQYLPLRLITSVYSVTVFVLIFISGGVIFSYYMSHNPQLVNGFEDVRIYLTSQAYGDRLHGMTESDFRERGIPISSFDFNSVSYPPLGNMLQAKVHVDHRIKHQVAEKSNTSRSCILT